MLYATQHQTSSQSRVPVELEITASGRNLNLRSLAEAAGYNGTSPAAVVVTIAEGVVIGSTSTSAYALDTGAWPQGSILTLSISSGAFIAGAGGNGGGNGGGLNAGGGPGEPGGPALKLQTPTKLINHGTIGGGGGGGGGANDTMGGNDSPFGGGGAGDRPGDPGKAWAGTLTQGGTAHRDAAGGDGQAGNGGAMGSPGQPGWRAGGAAGLAIDGLSFVTFVTQGTILGAST